MEGRSTIRNNREHPVPAKSRVVSTGGEVTALERGIRVLEAVIDGGPESTLAEIAARVALPKSTVHRLLQTFISLEYLELSSRGSYRGSSRLLAMAARIVESVDYAGLIGPALRDLQSQTLETIHFGILDGQQAVYVEKLPGRRAYQMKSRVGHPLPLHCSAIGKAILAFLPADHRDRLVGEIALDRRTDTTITSRQALEADLTRTRARWWALDDEENEKGIRCMGTPVFDQTGRVIGAISVSAPVFDFTLEDAQAFAPVLRATARRASHALGAPDDVFDARGTR
jgi:IclR family transcriptional regulator, acetate operon repressor